MTLAGKLPWDWHDGVIPANAEISSEAYLETTYIFGRFRSNRDAACRVGKGASIYGGTMLDVSAHGQVQVGAYTTIVAARIICDQLVQVGDYCLISWNVLLMDSYRQPFDLEKRRRQLELLARTNPRYVEGDAEPRPVVVGNNVWIGFDACVLPGVSIGDGSIVGARSVVAEDVPPYTIVAGNPARVIRNLEKPE